MKVGEGAFIVSTQMRDEYDFLIYAQDKDEAEIRAAFEGGEFSDEAKLAAHAWLLRREREDRLAMEGRDRTERHRAIAATERSARWALWAAIGSVMSALAAAAAVLLPLFLKK